jgi:hypothetical protein
VRSIGKRDPEKEKYWRDTIRRWQSSGQNKSQFCQPEKIKLSTFCHWVSVIARRDAEKLRQEARERIIRRREQRRRSRAKVSSSQFVEARVSNEHGTGLMPVGDQIEISTPDGFVIKLPGGANSALLIAVLQVLR